VLAERIDQGQYSLDEALAIADAILFQTPQQLLGMKPRNPPGGRVDSWENLTQR